MKDKIFDIAIVGSGPAGMTAAIYAGRANKDVLIIDKEGYGGQIAKSPLVENIPGFSSISGIDFATNMYMQMTALPNIEHVIDEVKLLSYRHGLIGLCCDNEVTYFCKTLIIATGLKPKELKLNTKDIYYCVTCGSELVKNKTVLVVGSGNTGATYALELATYCKDVYISDITMNMCCEATLQDKINATENIHWLPNCTISNVHNNTKGKLTSVDLSTFETIKCNAIFAAIGMEPQTAFANGFVDTDKYNYIISCENCLNEKVPNVFIAGDCRQKGLKQVTTAVADGAMAAMQAIRYVQNLSSTIWRKL